MQVVSISKLAIVMVASSITEYTTVAAVNLEAVCTVVILQGVR